MKKLLTLILTISLLTCFLVSCGKEEIKGNVNLVSEATHDAVVLRMVKGEIDIAVLPEPKATAAIIQAKQQGFNYSIKLNISDEWDKISDSGLSMGCIVVNNSLIEKNEKGLNDFLALYKSSIEYIGNQDNHDNAAEMIVAAGIIPKLPIAKSALNNLYGAIVYKDGKDMKNTLVDFYNAIGQEKPSNDFYYIPKSNSTTSTQDKIVIGVMNGPTGMGMAKLMSDKNANYEFRMYSDPSLATADLAKGDIDMACLPTNTAATLYTKGNDIKVASINCLGSLYVLVKEGVDVTSVESLIDKTVYYGVPNSTTEPIISYILKKNNIEVNSDK
jgi:ABC-type nitrate/sulfonate/bicarbonate transport system substrate-binding protein